MKPINFHRRDAVRKIVSVTLLTTCEMIHARLPSQIPLICIFDAKGRREADIFKEQVSKLVCSALRWDQSRIRVVSWNAPQTRSAEEVATEIAAMRPTIVIATSATLALTCSKEMPSVPILFSSQEDPRKIGLALDLIRPGRNATGVWNSLDLHCKRVELLTQLAPTAKHIAIVLDAVGRRSSELYESMANCSLKGLTYSYFPIASLEDVQRLKTSIPAPVHGIVVPHSNAASRWPSQIVAAVASLSIPAIFDNGRLVTEGAMASLEPVELDAAVVLSRLAANVLKGVPPSSLPIERPKTTSIAINLRTAKRLGLEIPIWMLKSANRLVL